MTEQRPATNVDTRDLDTPERLATTGRAVAEGVGHALKGEHETERAASESVDRTTAERTIDSWPDAPKNVARQMIDKYGPPNEATPTRLFWYRKGPWKRIEISADPVVHNWPAPHEDFFTQVIDYRVPPQMVHLITMFDGSILVDRTRGEVWARCDSEAANVLGLNMVHEIVTGKRTVEEARETSSQNTVAYNMGRSAPYAERLQFEIPAGGTEDLDRPMIARPIAQQAVGKLKDVVTGRKEEATDRPVWTGLKSREESPRAHRPPKGDRRMTSKQRVSLIVVALAVVSAALAVPALQAPSAADAASARENRQAFHDAMRKLWEDHITWTRLFIVSKATLPTDLPDISPTVDRLLQNQEDIGDAIKPFYGTAAGDELTALLRVHILTAADILSAAKEGDSAAQSAAIEAWYANAHDIAVFLHELNPRNWPLADLDAMMKDHLDLTLVEAVARLEGRYADDVAAYEDIHLQILEMADMLSDGIIRQFPQKFAG